jgi:hypothetical protein
VDEDV